MKPYVLMVQGLASRALPLVPAVLESLAPLRDILIGLGIGAAFGRLVVYQRERGGRELPARRARQITTRWEIGAALVGGIVGLVAELL